MMMSASLLPLLEPFTARFAEECITGSAIAPSLYEAAITIVSDTEIAPGGEVCYPIHEALNWKLTRFGHQARTTQYAALFRNEGGLTWQAKLEIPLPDRQKGNPRKYETPVGNGSCAFFPQIPLKIRKRISSRYEVDVPEEGSFWEWVSAHPELPIVLTEGGKKGLALLSQGYISLALYGVNGGYRSKDGLGNPVSPYLIADVASFAVPTRSFIFAFDQDAEAKTRFKVNLALSRMGGLLSQAGCLVAIAQWSGQDGKGVDDLIVNQGSARFDRAYQEALPLEHWRIWQRLERQLTLPAQVILTTADLSTLTLEDLPDTGIIGIASAKGTGKTKFIGTLTREVEKVLSGTHRIALGRNLSQRLGLDWRGDLDRVGGEYINGASYTLRIGFCVDSLLAIDPEKFRGCDLIIDELVQVLRHLLTSSTCAKDGKRPALLARFRELVIAAKRVIVADADLNDASLHYLQSLREDESSMFLVRNDYQSSGYPVRFLDAPDRSTITAEMLTQANALPPGKVLFVCTDSKGYSKTLATLLEQQAPEKRVLLINAETSGGECERAFIQSPDTVLDQQEYDVIIASPSMATGVSLERQGVIQAVYGIFTGVSATDADMAQALGRVREPVDRVVWCAKVGSNRSTISPSTHFLEFKNLLLQATSATVRLVRSSLKEDVIGTVERYDWQADPHLNLYCRFATEHNFSMRHLRDVLLVRLKAEGNHVTVESRESNPVLKLLLKDTRQALKDLDAEELLAASDLTYTDVLALEQKEVLSPKDRRAIAKFYLKDFYCLDGLTLEDILWDNEGRRRSEILNLEAQLYPSVAIDRTVRQLEKQASWQRGLCPWDLSQIELRRAVREKLGLNQLIEQITHGWEWTRYDLKSYADRARQLAAQVKVALHFTISEKVSDVQIIHQLLAQVGIHVKQSCWSRSVGGHEGEKLRVYVINAAAWHRVAAILAARAQKRADLSGSPSREESITDQGDPAAEESTSQNSIPVGEAGQTQRVQIPFGLTVERLRPSDGSDCQSLLG